MAALGYVYTLGNKPRVSPERCMRRNATSAEFLEVQIPPCILVYDWDLCLLFSARTAQKFGWKKKRKRRKKSVTK